jgi:stage II sporulation protein GA (sporulation sigma-E factor processing peptidase)
VALIRVIYIDSVFLLNLIINYLLLLVAAKITGVVPRRLRVLCGALVGAVYAVAVWLPGMEFIGTLPGKALTAAAMSAAAFVPYSGRRFLRISVVFLAVSLTLGGGVLAVELLVYGKTSPGAVPSLPIDFKTLLLAAAVSYALLSLVFRRAARYGPKDLMEVRVTHGGRETRITALLDTGNDLRDPVSGAAVLIVDADTARDILNAAIPAEMARDPLKAMSDWKNPPARFRLVPYRAVGVESGFLLAFKPEAVWLGKNKQDKMLIALSPHPISGGEGYHALAGGSL